MGPRLPRRSDNLLSLHVNPQIAKTKIQKEVFLKRVAGPFDFPSFPNLQVSPLGLVHKKDGDMRIIHHLFYPENLSVNEFLDPTACSVHYSNIDQAAEMIALAGRGAYLAKTDIKSAFRLLPVSPGDFDRLGFSFQGKFYFDKMLPFGSSISCALSDKFSSFLNWLTHKYSHNNFNIHYLDDFLFCGSSYSSNCHHSFQTFRTICSDISVPISYEETVEPTYVLTFLGIELDSQNMTKWGLWYLL